MSDLTSAEIRWMLEAHLHAYAGGKIRDFIWLLEQEAEPLTDEADRHEFFKKRRDEIMESAEYKDHAAQRPHLSMALDELATFPKVKAAMENEALTVEARIASHHFLAETAKRLIAFGKVRAIGDLLRQPELPPAKVRRPKTLPSLAEVVKDAPTFLPALWDRLSREPEPLVTDAGEAIKGGYVVQKLTLLSEALVARRRILGNYSAEDVYRMICRATGHQEPERPRPNIRPDDIKIQDIKDRFLEIIDSL